MTFLNEAHHIAISDYGPDEPGATVAEEPTMQILVDNLWHRGAHDRYRIACDRTVLVTRTAPRRQWRTEYDAFLPIDVLCPKCWTTEEIEDHEAQRAEEMKR